MGFVEDYYGGYHNLVYDEHGSPDFEATDQELLDFYDDHDDYGGGGAYEYAHGGHFCRDSYSGGGGGGARATWGMIAEQGVCAPGVPPLSLRTARAVRAALAAGHYKHALRQACAPQVPELRAVEERRGWRVHVALADGTRFASRAAHGRKRDAEADAAAVAVAALLARDEHATAPRQQQRQRAAAAAKRRRRQRQRKAPPHVAPAAAAWVRCPQHARTAETTWATGAATKMSLNCAVQ